GVAAVRAFVEAGGTLVALDRATGFAINTFELPVRDVTRGVQSDAFFCPGSILRIDVDPSQPLAYGMSEHTAGFFSFSSAFDVPAGSNASTPVRYSTSDVLVSGWLDGEKVIAGKAAVAQVTVGAGHIVLLGFPVQHRGQS